MTYAARNEYVKLGKGSLLINLLDADGVPTGFKFMGNATSVGISAEPTTVELFSSTQAAAGLVARDTIRTSYLLQATLNEYTTENLKMFLLGASRAVNQAANASGSVLVAGAVAGGYYDLGARRLTNVAVLDGSTPLIAGTDYQLSAEHGQIYVRPGGAISAATDLTVTFEQPALSLEVVDIGTYGSHTGHIVFLADDTNRSSRISKDRVDLWRVSITPDGALPLIGDDYGSFNLSCSILSDGENHPDSPYGTWARPLAAAA